MHIAPLQKLKTLSEETKESLCAEITQLNLTRYITEVVPAIAEAKLKPSDIGAAVKVCSMLHQRYAEFTNLLIPTLTKYCQVAPKGAAAAAAAVAAGTQPETEQEKSAKFVKKR